MRFGSPPKLWALRCTHVTTRRTCSASGIRLPPASCTQTWSGTTRCAQGLDKQLGRERVVLGEARTPRAAVDEDVDRRVGALGREDVEPFNGGGPVRMALRGAQARAHAL